MSGDFEMLALVAGVALLLRRPQPDATPYMHRPLGRVVDDGYLLSGFRTPDRPGHDGVDIAAPEGAVVRAPFAGRVSFVQTSERWATRAPGPGRDAGAYVEIECTVPGVGPAVVRIMHLDETTPVGRVELGEPVGTVGPSDRFEFSRAHIHVEVRQASDVARYGAAIDPVLVSRHYAARAL